MPADAFGRPALTVLELVEGLSDVAARFPALAISPVWVKGPSLYYPVSNVTVTPGARGPGGGPLRTIIEVHLS